MKHILSDDDLQKKDKPLYLRLTIWFQDHLGKKIDLE